MGRDRVDAEAKECNAEAVARQRDAAQLDILVDESMPIEPRMV